MDDLAKRRAERKDDAKLWKPIDALEDVLASLKSGERTPSQLVIWYMEETPEKMTVNYCVAGVTRQEHVALLALAQRQMLEDWIA